MLKQTAYIGPLQFDIEFADGCENLCFPAEFERKTECKHTVYLVKMESCKDIVLHSKVFFELDGFDETNTDTEVSRYVYQNVDDAKRYYAQTTLIGNQITIKVNLCSGWTLGRSKEVWRFLMLEKLLNWENAVILHSASVVWNGKALLFSAPSGTGKSTQAELWKKYEDDIIGLNGDRNILFFDHGKWMVCGLPWHGTSRDCISMEVPLAAIAIVRQAGKDNISELSALSKFQLIYSELSRNDWDKEFAEHMTALVSNLISQTVIVQLNCTMNETAVKCLKKRLEESA